MNTYKEINDDNITQQDRSLKRDTVMVSFFMPGDLKVALAAKARELELTQSELLRRMIIQITRQRA